MVYRFSVVGVSKKLSRLSSEPLTIMAHRGKKPILVHAFKTKKNSSNYAWLVKWMKTAFGYFEDYGVAEMNPDERAEYQKVMKMFRPFLTSVDKAIRQNIIPSVDGAQGLIVVDGGGKLTGLPEAVDIKMPAPVSIPRLGVACRLNDP